jgi:hypothetical protein
MKVLHIEWLVIRKVVSDGEREPLEAAPDRKSLPGYVAWTTCLHTFSNMVHHTIAFSDLHFEPFSANYFIQMVSEKVFLFRYDLKSLMKEILQANIELGGRSDVYLLSSLGVLHLIYILTHFSQPFGIPFSTQFKSCFHLDKFKHIHQMGQKRKLL